MSDAHKTDGTTNKGSSAVDTELTVHTTTDIDIASALILRLFMLLDGCVFACEKSWILSARPPP